MTNRKEKKLDDLCQLATLRKDRSALRLAKVQSLIDRLQAKAEDLREKRLSTPGDVTEAIMQDRWDRWRASQLVELSTQLARLHAVAQPEREAHARNVARRAVLEKLREKNR